MLMLVLYSFLVSYAINSISIYLLFVFFLLDYKSAISNKIKTIKSNKLVLIYVLFFVFQFFGVLYSNNISFGLRRVSVMLPILIIPAVLFSEKLNYVKFTKTLSLLKYWIALVFIYHIIFHIFIDLRPLSNFVLYVLNDKLGISQFYVMFILLIPMLNCMSEIQAKNQISLNIVFLFLFLFFIILLANKTSFLVLFSVILIKSIFLFKNKIGEYRIFLTGFLFAVIIGLAFIPQIKKRIDVVLRTTDFDINTIITKNSVTFTNNTFEHRLLISYLSLDETKKHFPVGVGTGDFQDVLYEKYKKINFKRAILGKFNNHNQYLSEFLKTGVFGGVTFLLLIFMLLKSSSIKDHYHVYIIVCFAFVNLFESYLYRQHGVVIFSFIIPLFLVLDQCLKLKTETS